MNRGGEIWDALFGKWKLRINEKDLRKSTFLLENLTENLEIFSQKRVFGKNL